MSTLKARLLSLTAKRHESVSIPGVGLVWLHAMSEHARANFEAVAQLEANAKAVKRLMVIHSARETEDAGSAFIFSADDVEAMGAMDSAVVDKMATAAMKLSGFGDADLESLLGKPENVSETQKTESSVTLSV